MAPRIANFGQWRAHLLTQLRLRADRLADQRLSDLHDELSAYPGSVSDESSPADVVLPFRFRRGDRELSFFSISATVSTAMDVTVEELAIEAFCPAESATARALR